MHLFDSIDIFYVQNRLANLINYHSCHNHIHKEKMCMLYNQRDATYKTFFIIISALHVSGGFSAHYQELIKLYVEPWVLLCFPAVYR